MSVNHLDVRHYEWHIIVNPNAHEKKCLNRWEKVSGLLDARGIRYVMHPADAIGRGTEVARALCAEGHRHLMAVGGDGTINEVVDGIFKSGVDTRDVYLAVLPLGRGNDWARTHHFATEVPENVDILEDGSFMQHDIGRVQTLREGNAVSDRHFINIAGFGFDAEVIYDVTHNKPHFLGISVYVLGLLRTIFRYKSKPLTISARNIQFTNNTFLMVAALCQYNGGGMRQAPMAVPDDGLLDVVAIPNVNFWTLLRNFSKIFSGDHIKSIKGIRTWQTEQLEIVSDDFLRGEVEGELLETGNYRVELLPRALNVLTHLK